ncbi:MAG: hypothetical protein IAI50_05695 [Candidatus Eremiobacteraeota bacterium]|nr:hypothetical protein [Candidatus Eremiobacteraeota bacterium]
MDDALAPQPPPSINVIVRGIATPNHEQHGVKLQGYINPLAFIEVDEPWILSKPGMSPDDDALRAMLCTPGIDSSLAAVINRYKEISVEEPRIFLAPIGFLEKIVWPLRHAKMAYALGNPTSTIALCGMVCEMVTILAFEAHGRYGIGAHPPSHRASAAFGLFDSRKCTRARQATRINALSELGLIDQSTHDQLSEIANTRNEYLHVLSHSWEHINNDARKVFLNAVSCVVAILGLNMSTQEAGRFVLHEAVLALALELQSTESETDGPHVRSL